MDKDKVTSATERLKDEQKQPDFRDILREVQRVTDQTRKATMEQYRIAEEDRAQGLKQQTNAQLALQATTGERASNRGLAEEQRMGQFNSRELNAIRAQRDQAIANLQQTALNSAINLYGQESAQYNQNLRLASQLEQPAQEEQRQRLDQVKLGILANQAKQQGATSADEASALIQGALPPESFAPYFPAPTQYLTEKVGDNLIAYNPLDPKDSFTVYSAPTAVSGASGTSGSIGGGGGYSGFSGQEMQLPSSSFSNVLNYEPIANSQQMVDSLTSLNAKSSALGELERARPIAQRQAEQALQAGITDPVSAYIVGITGVPQTDSAVQLFNVPRKMIANLDAEKQGNGAVVSSIANSITGLNRLVNDPNSTATATQINARSKETYNNLINRAGKYFNVVVNGNDYTVTEANNQLTDMFASMSSVVNALREYQGNKKSGKDNARNKIRSALISSLGIDANLTEKYTLAEIATNKVALAAMANVKGIPSDKDMEFVVNQLVDSMSTPQQVNEFEQSLKISADQAQSQIERSMGLQGLVKRDPRGAYHGFRYGNSLNIDVTPSAIELPGVSVIQTPAGEPANQTPAPAGTFDIFD